MTTKWNLTDLYNGFDDPHLLEDLKQAENLASKYGKLVPEILGNYDDVTKSIEMYLGHYADDMRLVRKLQAYGHLTFATNSKSENALNLKSKVQKITSELIAPNVAFKTWLREITNLEELAMHSALISEHLFYLCEIKASAMHMLSQKEEIMIAKLSNTGALSWETLQSKVSSQLMGEVELNGEKKKMPIMAIRNLAFNSDASIRKTGYIAELTAYEKHAEVSAAALNGIKGEVLTVSSLRKYDSPLDETLFNSRMSRNTLDAMISSMESFLPEFRRYIMLKSKLLGHSGSLPFFDLFAPVSILDKSFTIEEAHRFIVEYFEDFSIELSEFADHCFKAGWIDFEPAEGKVGGAFCSNIPSIGQSRVLLNFTGKLKNVLTIAHELGHAFHGDRIKTESILNTVYPMPLAETASIFCETIIRNAVLKNADDDLKLSILENSLQSATQVVVDILSRYYFETELFEVRKDHPLSVDELKKLMIASQIKAYGDSLDPETLHPYMWLNKTHYYYSARNFYNFPYAFGLLFATGLYSIYLDDKNKFVASYDHMLRATGKMDIQSVCGLMGIDPEDRTFWLTSLKKIKEDIDLFEEIVNIKMSQ